ncbi:MAG: tetratricopeptide repeat protein [Granulosicoccus sp.]|nr:tetratricopeptide repeat protein [Granulosicoccus sp.]
MRKDSFGSPVSPVDADALAGINDFGEGFVAYETRSANVIAVADNHPESALANICAGILWMFLERPEAPAKSTVYSDRAEHAGVMNHREQGLLNLLKAWQCYDYKQVRAIADELTSKYVHDIPTLKIAQYHAFNAGDTQHMLTLAMKSLQHNQHQAPVHSMLAFAYEQGNDLDNAEQAAEVALRLDPDEPWAHHALAHVHLGRGSTRSGLEFLLQNSDSWIGLNSFMFTHNWWHVALFELAHGDVEHALNIYDQRCWDVQPEYSQDQIGAVSLLARLELAGVDVGDRWQRLKPYLDTRSDDVIQAFLSLQYLYGLARSSPDKAIELMRLIESQADSPQVTQDQQLWREVGIPAARGLFAHATGDYVRSAEQLAKVRSQLWRIGGSHAQRDLFDQVLLDARLQAGYHKDAQKMLEQRLRYEPENPILKWRLSKLLN